MFEWFGDIGGLYGLFFDFLGPVLMMIFVSDGSTLSIASELTDMRAYQIEENRESPNGNNCCQVKLKKLYIVSKRLLCRFCCRFCSKQTRREQRIKLGEEIVNNELDVTVFLKRFRTVEGILKEKFSKAEWTVKEKAYCVIKIPDPVS